MLNLLISKQNFFDKINLNYNNKDETLKLGILIASVNVKLISCSNDNIVYRQNTLNEHEIMC